MCGHRNDNDTRMKTVPPQRRRVASEMHGEGGGRRLAGCARCFCRSCRDALAHEPLAQRKPFLRVCWGWGAVPTSGLQGGSSVHGRSPAQAPPYCRSPCGPASAVPPEGRPGQGWVQEHRHSRRPGDLGPHCPLGAEPQVSWTHSGLFPNFHGWAGGCARCGAEFRACPAPVVPEGPCEEGWGSKGAALPPCPHLPLGDVTW